MLNPNLIKSLSLRSTHLPSFSEAPAPTPLSQPLCVTLRNKKQLVALEGKASQKCKNKINLFLPNAFNTPGDYKTWGLREKLGQNSTIKKEVPSHPQNPKTCTFPPQKQLKGAHAVLQAPPGQQPFLPSWLATPTRARGEQQPLRHQ